MKNICKMWIIMVTVTILGLAPVLAAEKTAPQPKEGKAKTEEIKQDAVLSDNQWLLRSFFSMNYPVTKIRNYITTPLGLRVEAGNKRFQWYGLEPFLYTGFSYGAGIHPVGYIYSVDFGSGVGYPYPLCGQCGIVPRLGVGYSVGSLSQTEKKNYTLPEMELSILFYTKLKDGLLFMNSLGYLHVFDEFVPGGYLTVYTGVSYAF